MSLFIAQDGSWGDATDLVIVDDTDWTANDYEIMGWFTDSERARFATEPHGMSPSQWRDRVDQQ